MKMIQKSSTRPRSVQGPTMAITLRDAGLGHPKRYVVHHYNADLPAYQLEERFETLAEAAVEYQARCTLINVDSGWDAVFVV